MEILLSLRTASDAHRKHAGGPYKTILTTESILGVGEIEMTLPMLSREFDEDLNDYAYKLQGDPIAALGDASDRDPDYVEILAEATQQLEKIREERNG